MRPKLHRTCEWPGCDKPHAAHGLCATGYNRVHAGGWQDHDTPPEGRLPDRPRAHVRQPCTWPGCNEPRRTRGLCALGYARVHLWGWIDHDTSSRPPTPETCTWPGCDEPHLARGLCHNGYSRVHKRGWLDHDTPPDERTLSTTLYLLLHPEWSAMKIGIGDCNRQREHGRHGWVVICTWDYDTRAEVMAAEDRVLQLWGGKRGYLTPEQMPQCGWTETIHIAHYDMAAVDAAIAA